MLRTVRKLPLLLLVLPLLLLAGCSSQFRLLVHNDTDAPLDVHLQIDMPPDTRSTNNDFRLAAGEVRDAGGWFGSPPNRIVVVAGKMKRIFRHTDYPLTMQRRSSMGLPIHLHLTRSGMRLAGPTFWEANQTTFVFGGFCCGAPLAFLGLVYLLVRVAQKRQQ